MENTDKIKHRLQKLKNPLILILILGLVIRLYYFFLTIAEIKESFNINFNIRISD